MAGGSKRRKSNGNRRHTSGSAGGSHRTDNRKGNNEVVNDRQIPTEETVLDGHTVHPSGSVEEPNDVSYPDISNRDSTRESTRHSYEDSNEDPIGDQFNAPTQDSVQEPNEDSTRESTPDEIDTQDEPFYECEGKNANGQIKSSNTTGTSHSGSHRETGHRFPVADYRGTQQSERARSASPLKGATHSNSKYVGSHRRVPGIEGTDYTHGRESSSDQEPRSQPHIIHATHPREDLRVPERRATSSQVDSLRYDQNPPSISSNGGHRHEHTHVPASMASNGARDYNINHKPPTQKPIDHASIRSYVPKDTFRPKPEPPDPTTVRLQLSATECIVKMGQSQNWQNDFNRFAAELIQEIKQSEDRVNALTKEMLAGRDRYQPIPDGNFKDAMNSLREDVKMLALDFLNAIRDVKLSQVDFRTALDGKILTENVSNDMWEEKRDRKFFVQSAIWRILNDCVFNSPFLVFGHEGPKLGETWTRIFSDASDDDLSGSSGLPLPTELSERWKSITGSRLEEKHGNEAEGCTVAARDIGNLIAGPLSSNTLKYTPQSGWGRHMNKTLLTTANLAIAMAKQRSRVELYIPNAAQLAKERHLRGDQEALGGIMDIEEDTPGAIHKDIAYVVIPGLRRWGDGLGTKLHQHTDLEVAQVKCI